MTRLLNMNIGAWRGGRQGLILWLTAASVFLFSRGVSIKAGYQPKTDTAIQRYAGSGVCDRCHHDISASHRLTAHFRTSLPPDDSTIKGSFSPGQNEFHYSDSLFVRMEKRDGQFYQVLYAAGQQETAVPFGIVVGSGTKGQTYLYWGDSNTLFQMPVSYFTPARTWSNSPGYPGIPIFDRRVNGRCLECHTSFAVQTNPDIRGVQARFDPGQLITGIDCERCHGPAGQHADWHLAHPGDSTAHAIIPTSRFTRQQQLDLCRFCHGGSIAKTRPSFTYLPGEKLNQYFDLETGASKTPAIDVHGNQYGLMVSSRCFRESALTCNTCHNPHREERDQLAVFADRCQSCHQPGHDATCPLTGKVSPEILIHCVDCHMPRLASKAITMYLPGAHFETPAQMRTHKIAVYPDATDAVLTKTGNGIDSPGLRRSFDMREGKWHYLKTPAQ